MNKRLDALLPLTRDHHHALSRARRLKMSAASDDEPSEPGRPTTTPELMTEISETLRLHVRFEEDELFQLIEKLVPLDRLEEIAAHRRDV